MAEALLRPGNPLAQRILVVEDEPALQENYRSALQAAGYHTLGLRRGEEVPAACASFRPHLILLDIRLAGQDDGLDVLERLRAENHQTFVIILTSLDDDDLIVAGLGRGADNYLVKPLSRAQLVARVRAELQRTPSGEAAAPSGLYRYGATLLDLNLGVARRGRTSVSLTDTWRHLLALGLQTPGQMVPYERVERVVFQMQSLGRQARDRKLVNNQVHRLRAELAQVGADHILKTKFNVGLVMVVPDEVLSQEPASASLQPKTRTPKRHK
jgi:DNA-binding response OmpR family regulator